MEQFREYLETEGVRTENNVEIAIPIQINESFLNEGLLYPYVDKKRFKKEEFYELKIDQKINPVEIDLSPKIEMIESQKQSGISAQSEIEPKPIEHKYLDLLDWSRIYFSLLEFRILKSWNNIIFSKETLRNIVEKDQAAYSLKCLETDIKPSKFEDIHRLEEIVVSILKKYLQSYHDRQRNAWTTKNMDVLKLDQSNGNFKFNKYKVTVGNKDPALIVEIQNFKHPFEKDIKIGHINFDRHLFQPLFLEYDGTTPMYETTPGGLNKGEKRFIEHLRNYAIENKKEFSDHRKMFVLRNLPKVGIGFFIETIYYYPDFIIWIKTDDMQKIIFADPKGLTHIRNGFEDEKIKLYEHLKDRGLRLVKQLLDRGEKQNIKLDSYIISVTPIGELQSIFHTSQPSTLLEHHILVQGENGKYIGKMLEGG